MIYVLDTHAFVWFLEKSKRLSSKAREILKDDSQQVVIPSIVLAEIKHLAIKGKTKLSLNQVLEVIRSDDRCVIYPLDSNVIEIMPPTLEIHDGIICGTALLYRDVLKKEVCLITKDDEIIKSGIIKIVW